MAERTLQADIAVVGAGPAGIAAAARAAEAGRSVIVLDAAPRPGGQIWRHRRRDELPRRARVWLDRLDRSGARVLCGAQVVDAYAVDARGVAAGAAGAQEGDGAPADARGTDARRADGHGAAARGADAHGPEPPVVAPAGAPAAGFRLLADVGGAAVAVMAGRLILATGARERFLPFPGWTLPNVFGVGGAQALLKAGASFAGRRVVVAGSGPLLLAVAASLVRHGARVAVVAEQAGRGALLRFGAGLWRSPGRLVQAARYRATLGRTRYAAGCWVVRADGDDAVREVTLTDGRRPWTEPCDILCTGYGLVPNTELAEWLGCAVDAAGVRVDDRQRTTIPGIYCAGEPTGVAGVDAALAEGEVAGIDAAGAEGAPRGLDARRRRERRLAQRMDRAFALRTELRDLPSDDTILCRCEDVTRAAVDPAWSFRQAKLYSRLGMGPCQARVCGPACAFLFGWERPSVRAPTAPAAASVLAAHDG
ncbi:MAG TPA: FAD-dependent oxidoreductase [Longimicrobiales bacterium]